MAAKRKKKTARTGTRRKKPASSGAWRLVAVASLLAVALVAAAVIIVKTPAYRHRVFPLLTAAVERISHLGDAAPRGSWQAELYFADSSSDRLVRETRALTAAGDERSRAQAVLRALMQDSGSGTVSAVPAGTRVRAITHGPDGLLTIDFSSELSRNHPGGSTSELLTVYSIVNSLTGSLPGVQRVRILIQGRPIDTLAGHIDCRTPFAANQDIVN